MLSVVGRTDAIQDKVGQPTQVWIVPRLGTGCHFDQVLVGACANTNSVRSIGSDRGIEGQPYVALPPVWFVGPQGMNMMTMIRGHKSAS